MTLSGTDYRTDIRLLLELFMLGGGSFRVRHGITDSAVRVSVSIRIGRFGLG